MWRIWKKPPPYQKVLLPEENTSLKSIGQFRLSFRTSQSPPAMCSLINHSIDDGINNDNEEINLIDACVLGGLEWNFQKVCRYQNQELDQFYFQNWAKHLGMLVIYLISAVSCIVVFVNSSPDTVDENGDPTQPLVGILISVSIVTALYIAAFTLLNLKTGMIEFQARLDPILHKVSEELRDTGYTLSQDSYGYSGAALAVNVKRSQVLLHHENRPSLPPVDNAFQEMMTCRRVSQTAKTEDKQVDMNKVLDSTAASGHLPVDFWVTGGLMLRLRTNRYEASQKSRWFAIFVLLPVYVLLSVLFVAVICSSGTDEKASSDFIGLHSMLASLVIGGILGVVYIYSREAIDGAALHRVSRDIVRQFSSIITEKRHKHELYYGIEPDSCILPNLTKGVIRFNDCLHRIPSMNTVDTPPVV